MDLAKARGEGLLPTLHHKVKTTFEAGILQKPTKTAPVCMVFTKTTPMVVVLSNPYPFPPMSWRNPQCWRSSIWIPPVVAVPVPGRRGHRVHFTSLYTPPYFHWPSSNVEAMTLQGGTFPTAGNSLTNWPLDASLAATVLFGSTCFTCLVCSVFLHATLA